ncbi:hypothetical protein [uncultured Sphingobacterium sp.]|uniref:hypothetical protein n=1 Tax=uncultured Sphingobacterium sp. TaxID=182688 RepID=UPI0025F788D7|nr:hypothetical protein [uncultured Sphingobacterium sp.]
MDTKPQNRLTNLLIVFLGVVILMSLALYNGYPLVFNHDSGVYLENAFDVYVSPDRPVMYSLFIKFVSRGYSFWLVPTAQALLLSYVLYLFFEGRTKNSAFIFSICFLSLFMGLSFEVSWLMPDVFAGVLLSCMILLLFFELQWYHKLFLYAMVIFCTAVHNSNSYIAIGSLFLSALLLIPIYVKSRSTSYILLWKKIGAVFATVVFAILLNAGIHKFLGGDFESSKGGSVFLFSNLIEMGVVDEFLDQRCPDKKYRLCTYKDSLPNNFLWDSNSPINKTDGWKHPEEYQLITKDILLTPEYTFKVGYQSAIYTLKQLVNFDVVDIGGVGERVKKAVFMHIPQEHYPLMTSREAQHRLDISWLNYFNIFFFFAAVLFNISILRSKSASMKIKMITVFIFLILIVNAFICSVFSGVHPRYQGRISWTIILPFVLIYQNQIQTIITKFCHYGINNFNALIKRGKNNF